MSLLNVPLAYKLRVFQCVSDLAGSLTRPYTSLRLFIVYHPRSTSSSGILEGQDDSPDAVQA